MKDGGNEGCGCDGADGEIEKEDLTDKGDQQSSCDSLQESVWQVEVKGVEAVALIHRHISECVFVVCHVERVNVKMPVSPTPHRRVHRPFVYSELAVSPYPV